MSRALLPEFFPDFFIVGAPRCGTTSLYRYLKTHPQISCSRPKETHFFSTIAPALPESDLQVDYLDRYFSHREPGQLVGEATATYLYSAQVLETILRHNPEARFIAMVRNPLDMLPSYHQLMLLYGEEDKENFGLAWRLRKERARGHGLPKHCLDPRLLQYGEIARFGKYVEQLQRIVGTERCLVILFDDFKADTRTTYLQVLRFLGVDDDGKTHFPTARESRRYRFRRLHWFLFPRPRTVEDLAKTLHRRARYRSQRRPPLQKLRKGLRRVVRRLNVMEGSTPPLDADTRAELVAELESDVALLSRLLDRDLRYWLD